MGRKARQDLLSLYNPVALIHLVVPSFASLISREDAARDGPCAHGNVARAARLCGTLHRLCEQASRAASEGLNWFSKSSLTL